MKRLIIILAICAAALARADEDILARTLRADGSVNTWTATDLSDALGLMNRKYWRDMQSESGRKAWHGPLLRTMIDTNALIKVFTYEDGFEYTNTWTRPVSPVERDIAAAAARAEELRERLRGRPSALAEIYTARLEAETTPPQTVEVEVGTSAPVTIPSGVPGDDSVETPSDAEAPSDTEPSDDDTTTDDEEADE